MDYSPSRSRHFRRSFSIGLCVAAFLSASGPFATLFAAESVSSAAATASSFKAVAISKTPPTIAWGSAISDPKEVILCIHGLGLHKGCYDDFGKLMASKGIPVYALDIRGFGDWHLNGNDHLDLPQSLVDIKQTLITIKQKYPNAAVFLLGESMGGAIALRATAIYPDLIKGLISSVPSGDRWSGLGEDLKVGLHVLAGGFGGRFDVGTHVVEHATEKNAELRKRWEGDPASRSQFSPNELLAFQGFMDKNNEAAAQVKTTPVLVLQGAQDKLVRPGGSSNVWDHLATPDRTFAASKTAEHLIFEYGQFSPDDINFVMNWMTKALSPLPDQTVSNTAAVLPEKPKVPEKDEMLANAPNLGTPANKLLSASPNVSNVSARPGLPSLAYWIELMRDGKHYRCNNKTTFHSGDEIRIHVSCSSDGYAYILMKQGTSGAHAVLFPDARTGRNNAVTAMADYALPSATWLKFDENPGTEKISLIFSKAVLDPDTNKYMKIQTVIVSADRSGAKDLCPTRMQISWDDPNPLIMPPSAGSVALASSSSSVVRVSQKDELTTVMAIDIDLEHQK